MEQKKLPLKYQGYSIVCEEVPDEVSLAFNISGCPHKCEGCHSKYLWEYKGEYLYENFGQILSIYKDMITCVLFMGGDQNLKELAGYCFLVKSFGLKVCIYSGLDNEVAFSDLKHHRMIDYLKIGSYQKNRGGLNQKGTNQYMLKFVDGKSEDITYKFQNRHLTME